MIGNAKNCKVQILIDLLGISQWQARYLISKNKIKTRHDDHLLVDSIRYCQSLYSNEEILKFPELIGRHPMKMENHYLTMKEGGFHPLKANVLSKSIYYMRSNVNDLKVEGLIPKEVDVAKSFLSYLKDQNLASIIYKEYVGSSIWNQIHLNLMQQFLKHKLKATESQITDLFKKYKMLKNKSFTIVQENISIAESLGFEPKTILKYGYILSNNPNYTKQTLKEFSNLAGADMRRAMRLHPKLVTAKPTNFSKIYGILKNFDIFDEEIKNGMNVFSLNPDTVKMRLTEIQSNSDLKPLLRHPSVLKLIVHHNRVKFRLSFLKDVNLKCASTVILNSDNKKRVEQYAKVGADTVCQKDILAFLQQTFGMETDTLLEKLKRHPYHRHVPLKTMQETYDFLLRYFSGSHVYRAIYILLYPKEKIRMVMKKLKKEKQQFKYKSLNDTEKLNIILYTIEREHHFTGNGIWDQKNLEVSEKSL